MYKLTLTGIRMLRLYLPNPFNLFAQKEGSDKPTAKTDQQLPNVQTASRPQQRLSSLGKELDALEKQIANANIGLFIHYQNLMNNGKQQFTSK